MSLTDVRTLYWREIRSALRDRTIVANSILLPIFLYPAIIWLVYTGFTFISGQNEDLKSRIMLKDLPPAHSVLKKEFETDSAVEIVNSADPAADIRAGTLDAMIEFVLPETGQAVPDNVAARITYDESRDAGFQARNRVNEKIARYRESYLQQQATELGLSPADFQNFAIEQQDVSSGQGTAGILVVLLPILLIIMLAVGAMHPAIDATAGEREHSTWETLMTAATSRANVLVAKYLYVATMAFIAAFLNLIAILFSMGTVLAPYFGNASLRIPLHSVPVVLAGTVLLALFVAAGMMILASFARNYKEGQSMVSPFYIALIMPVLFLQAPGIEFTTSIALIPVANVMIMIREAFQGIYHWRPIAITLAVEAACVILALRLAMAVIQHDDVLMGSFNGSFGRFMKERLLRRQA